MTPIELTDTLVTSLARRWECAHLPAMHELLDAVSDGAALGPTDRALLATVREDLAAVAAVAGRDGGAATDAALRIGALQRATGALTDAILTRSAMPQRLDS